MGKKEARWNEIKGELDDLLDVAPFPTFINEAIYHHHLIIYQLVFPHFKVDDVPLNTFNMWAIVMPIGSSSFSNAHINFKCRG